MEISDLFKYEEKEGKKYLVHEKNENDVLDVFSLEMISNNKIEGLLPFSCIRIDCSFTMKYDITGLTTLKKVFSEGVNRHNLLEILESIADVLMRSEDYMLDISSYLLDERYIYIDSKNNKVYMVVLPIRRKSEQIDIFFKKLLFDVQYDRNEDCSYVASLVNILGNDHAFSIPLFREKIIELKKSSRQEEKEKKKVAENFQKTTGYKEKQNQNKTIAEESSYLRERQRNMEILFSHSEDQDEKKKKRGFFFKREKDEKKEEKNGIFGKKKKTDSEKKAVRQSPFEGISIPGMDLLNRVQNEQEESDGTGESSPLKEERIPIPVQHVDMELENAEQQDFGKTFYKDEEADLPTVFDMDDTATRGMGAQGYTLYRCKTQETFEIKGKVIRIGRSPSISEICISGNPGIGRVHAVLYVEEGQVYISDNNSKNKTYVDDRVLKPGEHVMLFPGSKILLGKEELEFRISK